MSKITIREVAKALNISTSTVSRALSGSHEVSGTTRERVKAMADKLGFSPDLYASNLRSRKSNSIAVIIPDITDSFYSSAIGGIEKIARENGYHVLIYISKNDYSEEVKICKLLLDGRVDGVLIAFSISTHDTKHIEELTLRNTPVVVFRRSLDVKVPKVVSDDFMDGFKAAQYLIERGCQNVLYLAHQHKSQDNVLKGFSKYIEQTKASHHILNYGIDICGNEAHLINKFHALSYPDGILCTTEKLALTVLKVIEKLPDLSLQNLELVSFFGSEPAILYPSLTSILLPSIQIGQQACICLIKSIKTRGVDDHEEVICPSQFVVNQSVNSCQLI